MDSRNVPSIAGERRSLQGALLLLAGIGLLTPLPSRAQLPAATAASLGTANNYTALARGFSAVSLSPAALALPGTPTFSLAFLPVQASQSLQPVSLADIGNYGGRLIPASVKEDWLRRIASSGGQTGGGVAEVTGLAVNYQFGGLQFSTIASGRTMVSDAAAELLLFGNAGRTGSPGDFDLQGSRVSGFVVSTLGVSAAVPLGVRLVPGLARQRLALGATLKRSWGNALVYGEDAGSLALSDPLRVDVKFPIIHTGGDSGGVFDKGTGLGLDVGAAWVGGRWKAAALVQNVFNTYAWDLETMVYRPGTAAFDQNTHESDFDERPASQAPRELRDRVEALTFEPVLGLGLAFAPSERLSLTADLRRRTGEGLEVGPKSHLGAGAEYRPSPRVPLRAGFAVITAASRWRGGRGWSSGPFT